MTELDFKKAIEARRAKHPDLASQATVFCPWAEVMCPALLFKECTVRETGLEIDEMLWLLETAKGLRRIKKERVQNALGQVIGRLASQPCDYQQALGVSFHEIYPAD